MEQVMAKRFKALILILTLMSTSVIDVRAESELIDAATVIRETNLRNARPSLPTALRQPPYRKPCNPKRRALIGAVVGSAVGMVAVRKASESNDGAVGMKTTLQAGGRRARRGRRVCDSLVTL